VGVWTYGAAECFDCFFNRQLSVYQSGVDESDKEFKNGIKQRASQQGASGTFLNLVPCHLLFASYLFVKLSINELKMSINGHFFGEAILLTIKNQIVNSLVWHLG
jgi:hypothetical protein